MSRNLYTVEMNNRNVVLIQVEPLDLFRIIDVYFFVLKVELRERGLCVGRVCMGRGVATETSEPKDGEIKQCRESRKTNGEKEKTKRISNYLFLYFLYNVLNWITQCACRLREEAHDRFSCLVGAHGSVNAAVERKA